MKKIIFIDVDGTIYKSHKDLIDESVKQALFKAKDEIDLYLATGRCKPILKPLGDAISYFKGFILSNGALVIADNKKVHEDIISREDLEILIKESSDLNINLGLITNNKIYVNEYNAIVDMALSPYEENSIIDLKGYHFDLNQEYNMAWTFNYLEDMLKLEKRLTNFHFFKWGNIGSDIIIKDVSKGHGIKALLDTLPTGEYKTYAIGDANNDIEMFSLVDVAICMGNGSDRAKAEATYITKSIFDGGFEEALDKILKGEW